MPIPITTGTFDIYEMVGVLHSAKEFVFREQTELKCPGQLMPITVPHSTGIYSKKNTAFSHPLGKFLSRARVCPSRFLTVFLNS